MSDPKNIFYCLLLVLFSTQCQQKNQLAQNELALITELSQIEAIIESEDKADLPGKYLNITEKPRITDPDNPPIILDIIGARSDVRDMKLTDLYSKVKYIPIRFKEPADSLWSRYEEFDFLITPNNIIASQYSYGITQFDLYGNFINQIVENDFYYTTVPGKKFVMITSEDNDNFIGAKGNVHAIGDLIYYQHHNVSAKTGMWMQYNATPGELSATMINQMENSEKKPEGIPMNSFQINNFRGSVSGLGANNIFPINEGEWASAYGKWDSSKKGAFMVSANMNGDTISKFVDHNPLRDFTGGAFRGVDGDGSQYSFGGIQHIRQGYNDTIYTLSIANQLIPKYVLNFGKNGIQSPLEGMDPGFSLIEKFVIDNLVETNRYLFIIYTKDYPSPNTAKKGSLFYNACIYDKAKAELFHIYLNEKPFVPPGRSWPQNPRNFIENNFDNGPAFWPGKITHDGLPFMAFKVSDLKDKSNLWQGNESMRNNIKKMKKTDYLLMIVE